MAPALCKHHHSHGPLFCPIVNVSLHSVDSSKRTAFIAGLAVLANDDVASTGQHAFAFNGWASGMDQSRDALRFPRTDAVSAFVILVAAVVVLFVGIGGTRLWDQDEGFFASAAAEMHARRDWVTPTFNGRLFSHKPPLMYWGMMAGFDLFGVNETGARFVSALCGLGTALVIWRLGRRLFNNTAGVLAGLVVVTSTMFTIVSRAATPDSHLTLFSLLAIALVCRDLFPLPTDRPTAPGIRWSTWIAAYVAMGFAVLAKGPIGFFFPMAVIGLYLLCATSRRATSPTAPWYIRVWDAIEPFGPVNFLRTVWRMRPLTAIVVVALVAGPWFYLVQRQTQGEFLREFIGVHHLGRFANSLDNHHGPWYYYIVACLVGMFPWSLFLVPVALLWWKRLRTEWSPPIVLATCWVAVYLVIFSLARTKLPNYVLPAYPALALLVGHYLETWWNRRAELSTPSFAAWLTTGQWVFTLFGLGAVVICPLVGATLANDAALAERLRLGTALISQIPWVGLAGAPLLVGGLAVVVLARAKNDRRAVATLTVAAAAFQVVVWNVVLPRIDRLQTPQTIAANLRDAAGDSPIQVSTFHYTRPTMTFYLGGPITSWKNGDDHPPIRSGETWFVVTSDEHYPALVDQLPADFEIVERHPNFPGRGEVLVLARPTTVAALRTNRR